jgi:hypothetical protein
VSRGICLPGLYLFGIQAGAYSRNSSTFIKCAREVAGVIMFIVSEYAACFLLVIMMSRSVSCGVRNRLHAEISG